MKGRAIRDVPYARQGRHSLDGELASLVRIAETCRENVGMRDTPDLGAYGTLVGTRWKHGSCAVKSGTHSVIVTVVPDSRPADISLLCSSPAFSSE